MSDIAASNTMDPDALIARLRERGAELGLHADSDEALLEAVLEHDVQVPEPDAAACRRYYDAHSEQLRRGEIVEADHILFAVTDGTPIDLLRKRVEEVLLTLLSKPEQFGALARQFSNCPSGQLGGSLGQLGRDACVPEFWAALLAHGNTGLIPHVVHTRFGLHIVRIHRFVPGQLPPFEALHEEVALRLKQEALVHGLQLYAEDLQAGCAQPPLVDA